MKRVAGTGAWLGVLIAVGACGVVVPGGDSALPGSGHSTQADGDDEDVTDDLDEVRRGPLPDGGASSCVETYAPKGVARRAFAFDGVVVEVGPSVSDRGDDADLGLPGVTIEVREWFSDSHGDTITVDMQAPATASDKPSNRDDAYGVGSRLLVSGEGRWGGSRLKHPIAWGCGFSRYYDPETASAWRDAGAS